MKTISFDTLLDTVSQIESPEVQRTRKTDFDSLFLEAVYQKFDKNTIMSMQYCLSQFNKGFEEAKKLNFEMADYYFGRGQEAIDKNNFSEDIIKYLTIYITPKLSYYHYKKGNHAEAEQLTWKALFETQKIEQEFPNMHMGKIQQLHNVVRVLTRQKEYQQAHGIETGILSYLLFNHIPDIPGDWTDELVSKCDRQLLSLMTLQVFSEKIVNLITIPDNDQRFAVEYFASCTDPDRGIPEDEILVQFFKCIRAYKEEDTDQFLYETQQFLKKAPAGFNASKQYLLLLCISLLDAGSAEADADQLVTLLQEKIRVTPWMANKYKSSIGTIANCI